MTRSQTDLAWDTFLDLSRAGPGPLHARLARALRDAIRDGVLPPGSAVPPSRQLAVDLSCSRWVVTEAYGQLVAEGYLDARTGSATRVSRTATPDRPKASGGVPDHPAPPRFQLAPGLPDLRAFPRRRWLAALRSVLDTAPFSDLGLPDPAGHERLRTVLAEYLQRVRAVSASPDVVTVTRGASDGMTRVVRAVAHSGVRRIAVEDPGWTRLREAVRATGQEVVGVPVDAEGIRVDGLAGLRVDAVIVAPAHQFPTGALLSPERRRALLVWAERAGALVIEDDYDAEFRYDRQPMAALQGMAPDRVALVGSVSKTLSPGMGVGWVVAPTRWLPALRAEVAGTPPVLDQLALAELMASGGYDRHLRGARQRFRARRDALLTALAERLPQCTPSGEAAGLHLLLHLPEGLRATEVVERGRERGLHTVSLEGYRIRPAVDDTLVLGYANLPDSAITAAVGVLAEAVVGEAGD